MRILTKEDQEKQYAKYYALSLFPPPHQMAQDIKSRMLDEEHMIPLENRDEVLKCYVEQEYIGYGYLEGSWIFQPARLCRMQQQI